jgi:branched-subunit amino acid aminotransferase/4-amino-4-deoxychorismate lyase
VHELFEGLPLGVYSALRTYERARFLWLDAHIERTQRSIDALGWEFRLDAAALRRALDALARAFPGDARVRFDVLAEPATALATSSRVLVAFAPFAAGPRELLERGAALGVARGLARHTPRVKLASFVVQRKPHQEARPALAELVMLDEAGAITEGLTSNFHGVKDGVLVSRGEGVLEGVTRRVLLEVARRLGVPFRDEPIALDGVGALDEACFTSSMRGVVPVVAVEGRRVGSGRPGPLVRRLREAYDAFAEREARPARLES